MQYINTNPLSYQHNSHADLSLLVKTALLALGCSANKLPHFDAHSTISIEIADMPDINLSIINDRLWIWAKLDMLTQDKVATHAHTLIDLMSEAVPYIETGHFLLAKCNIGYEIKGLIDLSCLNEYLSDIIKSLHRRLHLIIQLTR